jgi:hypothetical protein
MLGLYTRGADHGLPVSVRPRITWYPRHITHWGCAGRGLVQRFFNPVNLGVLGFSAASGVGRTLNSSLVYL